jgi:hypothetical protein
VRAARGAASHRSAERGTPPCRLPVLLVQQHSGPCPPPAWAGPAWAGGCEGGERPRVSRKLCGSEWGRSPDLAQTRDFSRARGASTATILHLSAAPPSHPKPQTMARSIATDAGVDVHIQALLDGGVAAQVRTRTVVEARAREYGAAIEKRGALPHTAIQPLPSHTTHTRPRPASSSAASPPAGPPPPPPPSPSSWPWPQPRPPPARPPPAWAATAAS